MTQAVPFLTVIGAGLTAYMLLLLLRYPHLRRMAWRSMLKQKRSTLLTVVGLAISTSFISMTIFMNTALTAGMKTELEKFYGRIAYDVPSRTQEAADHTYFDLQTVQEIRQNSAGVSLPIMSLPATFMTKNGNGTIGKISPYVNVIGVDSAEAIRFEPFLSSAFGSGLQRNEVLLSSHAAEMLGVKTGDTVYAIDNSNRENLLTVTAVVPEHGLTGYPGIYHGKATAIVDLDTARSLEGVQGTFYTNLLLTEPLLAKWEAVPVRDDFVTERKNAIAFITVIIGIVSLNAILIGIVLITNIFRLIAEERRSEMGILRTVGLRKFDVGRLMMLEGLLCGFCSGIFGVSLGLALAYLLLDRITASFDDVLLMDVKAPLQLDPGVIFSGLGISMLFVYICVKLIARQTIKLSVVEAIRPVQPKLKSDKTESIPRKWMFIICSLFLVFCTALIAVPDIRMRWITDNRLPLIIAMIFLSLPVLVWVFVQLLPLIEKGLLYLFRNLAVPTLIIRLALRNMNIPPLRTGLLLFLFAVVSCFISFSILYSDSMSKYMNDSKPVEFAGGHDLVVRDWRPLDTESVVRHMATSKEYAQIEPFQLSAVQQLFWKEAQGPNGPIDIKINGIDRSFAESNDIPLRARDDRYASDRETWSALADSDEAVIVAENLLKYNSGNTNRVGDTFPIVVGDRTVFKTIIAIAAESGYQSDSYGIWIHNRGLARLAESELDIHSTVFIKLGLHTDHDAIEKISRLLALQNISPVKSIVKSENSFYVSMIFIVNLLQGFNIAALGIGMLGLIVVMYRLVRQRSRSIGMLRTIGIGPKTVVLSLLLEGFFIGSFGLSIGFTVGTAISYLTFNSLFNLEALHYSLPLMRILAYFGAALACSLALSYLPARKALLVPPTEATRTTS
ncbi:ABC transporter permease [Paenibacillus ginsengarvi]|uniref:FtsX-like permease family protein n=1 Tax=Paenibacillus ginsengarvi TaxID=400777 RepID=A0A3B0BXB9_9BACL|nr:FtsX-like permease family protein [Paenibacillus ginsengarvi]RKN77058.1 FtsX-like permease family protein [Paenibacillus ginsengarvi]